LDSLKGHAATAAFFAVPGEDAAAAACPSSCQHGSTISLLKAVEAAIRGATVLTPTERLARELTRQFGLAQRKRGSAAWPTPSIFPFDAFLGRLWREWLFTAAGPAAPVLLNPLPERTVFEQAISECERDQPLQIAATARAALQAWQLAHEWHAPLSDSRFAASEDCAAFARWARAFDERCRRENWLDSARLPGFLADRLRDGSLQAPARVALAGFDELTPQQKAFLAALPRVDRAQLHAHNPAPARVELRDAAEEFEQAAGWARNLLAGNPQARIGVIVPNLQDCRAQVDRLFREVLHPGPFPSGARAYHLSLGLELADYPVVAAGLAALETGLPRMRADRAGMLLRSPFLGAATTERGTRAMADVKLRRDRLFELTPEQLRAIFEKLAQNGPRPRHLGLQASDPDGVSARGLCAYPALNRRPEQRRERQRPGEWARTFSRMLGALGWPGDRPLSSEEHQTVEAWNKALSSFATLDATLPELHYEQALRELRRLAGETTFQPEDEGAPVQILGVEEAAGLEFDALWVTGLHDEQFPREPRPNPFLPLALQRELNMPHATPQREAEYANAVLRRLISSADEVMLSWPSTDGEKTLQPSPLLDKLGAEVSTPILFDPVLRRWHRRATLESLHDEMAPPLAVDGVQSGGASLLKAMAECPFKAFALYRLNARPLEDAEFGVSASEKGTTVHRALETIWNELGAQAALLRLSEEETRALVRRHVEAALAHAALFRDLEQTRLERLIGEFLQLERTRQPFSVTEHEKEQTVEIGGLALKIRVDRVDEVAGGWHVLVDYKTGRINRGAWAGDRPREPQLPLYATVFPGALAAVTLAAIRTGEIGFVGIQENDVLGKAAAMKTDFDTIEDQQEHWKAALERLAGEFREGVARVHPARGACDYCELKALCRIRDHSMPEAPDADE
jgi:probable DNA repair protein